MLDLILVCLKYLLFVAVLAIIYITVVMVIPSYLEWKKYKKFKNVYTSDSFVPVLGDFYLYAKNMNEGKTYYAHLEKKTYDLQNYDLELIFEGPKSCLQIVSHDAHREFEQLMPDKIDRIPEDTSIGQMMPRTLGNSKTDDSFNFRKRTFLRLLSFNRSSQYIPMMVRGLDRLTGGWIEAGKPVDVIAEMFKQNFSVLTKILLGTDTDTIMKKLRPYKTETNEYVMVDLCELFLRTTDCYIDQYLNPMTMLLPFLNKYKLVDPFKRNHENNEMLRTTLQEAIDFSKDETSVLYNLREVMKDDPVQMLDDLMGVMMAGVDTSAHAFCTTLYFLKKNPEKLDKLIQELKDHGFDENTNMVEHLNKDTIEELDYLSYVVKETLRLDSPTIDTLNYMAKEDCKLCGVNIPKGQYIKFNLFCSNHNVAEHQKPFEFIPERFDPESDYFTRPADGKTRSVFSHIPFSHGQRGCPGQSLALLQLKVDLVYVLAKFHCKVEGDLMQKEGVGFALRSGIDMHATFTRK